jgi:hypothetical protein
MLGEELQRSGMYMQGVALQWDLYASKGSMPRSGYLLVEDYQTTASSSVRRYL